MTGDLLIQDRNATLAYPDRKILSGLNGEYRRGERWVVIGTNGAGKSTFLKSVLDSSLVTEGRRVVTCPTSKISYMAQNPRFLITIPCTVRDFLLSSLALTLGQNAVTRENLDRMEFILSRIGLRDKAHDSISTLSGGQMQRLCFGRALLLNSEVLLLDEPFAAVDPDSKDLLRTLIDELRSSTLQILVLHDPLDVLAVRGQILRAHEGRLDRLTEEDYRHWQRRRLDVVTFH